MGPWIFHYVMGSGGGGLDPHSMPALEGHNEKRNHQHHELTNITITNFLRDSVT